MAEDTQRYNKIEEYDEEYDVFDFDELEEKLQSQLDEELSDFEYLEEEKKKIGNPDALGKVIMDEIWNQFTTQVGLEMTNETLIQKYDREHPETYEEVGKKVMQDSRYKEANKAMKEKQKAGTLKDEYTGKKIAPNENANLDHTVARKEIYENKRRRQAGIATEDLANKSENLNPTNESLNKSKGSKSVDAYNKSQEQRERDLREQNRKANEKIDKDPNLSKKEKELKKKENDKRMQDKLDADAELMKEKDAEARKAINKDIAKGVAKETAKKAGKDALKIMAVQALSSMLKEIINALVRFFKQAEKSFSNFIQEMKAAFKRFLTKIKDFVKAGADSFVGTVISEIFGPVVSLFKKLASLIKQGVKSVHDAISYLKDKNNKNKPFSVKVAEVGKIVVAGLVATGALFGGEFFSKILGTIPGMAIQIPLLGSLADLVGMFLASVISGVIGAIIINFIDKRLEKKQKQEAQNAIIEKGNKVINLQNKVRIVEEVKLDSTKENVQNNIKQRHVEAAQEMRDSMENIIENSKNDDSIDETLDEMDELFLDMEGE